MTQTLSTSAAERYFADGVTPDEATRADVYVDGEIIRVGVRDGAQWASIAISTADAVRLSSLLINAAAHAEHWRLP